MADQIDLPLSLRNLPREKSERDMQLDLLMASKKSCHKKVIAIVVVCREVS